MKRYLSRILVCVIPVVLAAIVVAWAGVQYVHGQGGFRLGVDLSGGTILVYEVDLNKMTEQARNTFKPEDLAAALKHRIDPADLYNATIRPVPGDPPRVEIILPTGGRMQSEAEEASWHDVLNKVRDQYPNLGDVSLSDIPAGDFTQLTARLLSAHPTKDGKAVEAADLTAFVAGLEKQSGERHAFTGEGVEHIKFLIQQQGRLEFRILANASDDKDAVKAAKDEMDVDMDIYAPNTFEDAQKQITKKVEDLRAQAASEKDPDKSALLKFRADDLENRLKGREALKNEPEKEKALVARAQALNNLAINGDPPPSPGAFTATLQEKPIKYNYSWVEVGKQELYTLHLNSGAQKNDDHWKSTIFASRDRQAFLTDPSSGTLLYCREIPNPSRLSSDDQKLGKTVEWFVLTRETERGKEVTGDYLTSVSEGMGQGERAVDFSFNSEGANRFLELTTLNQPTDIQRQLAVVLDNKVESAPNLKAVISGSGQISGNFTPQEIQDLVRILRGGALPATLRPKPVSENTMGATLGEDTIVKGALSVGLAFAAVLIFMLIYYRFAGVVACVALIANLLLTVAFMVLVHATFTLPGLAGLVLMLGMAVDANVLIYERLREERERGASLALAVRNGYDRAFPTIIDTHLTSIFTAIVLYVVGNDQLKGFGISLTVGLIISLFTSLYVTRAIFDIWMGNNWLHKLYFMQLFKRPNINFMRIRHLMFALTGGATILGAALFVYHLFNGGLNIDFVGGTAYAGQLVKPVGLTELRDRIQTPLTGEAKQKLGVAGDLPEPSIEQVFVNDPTLTQGDKSALFTVRTSEKDAGLVQKIVNYKLGAEWGQIVGDKDDPGDLLKRIVMNPPPIDEHAKTVKEATLEFVKSQDDFNADKAKPVLVQDLKNSGLTLTPVEGGSADFYTLRLEIPSDNPTVEELKDRLERARDDLRAKGVEMAKVEDAAVEAKDGAAQAATLKFPKPQPDYASPAQVQMLVTSVFKDLLDVRNVKVQPAPGAAGREGRYSKMLLTLETPIPAGDFKTALTTVKDDFINTPQPERLENFDSQLARDTQEKALYAIVASWIAILIYLWFRFGSWTFGAATVVCLIHDLFFTLGAIALCHYVYVYVPWLAYYLGLTDFKIDLPSVAALLTLVGYSVSDTIVVFDRIREVRGKNPLLTYTMINDSVNQTLSRTILSSLTVFLVVGVLYLFGGEGVHLFAFVMVVGVVVGTYSSIYIASPLLIMFGEGIPKTDRAARRLRKPLPPKRPPSGCNEGEPGA